jgi:N-acetylglucosamine-6-phosphate deacetylase
MTERNIYLAGRLFTGNQWLPQHAVVVERGAIVDLLPANAVTGSVTAQYPVIAPALMDIQIYGAEAQLLAVHPTAEALEHLYRYCRQGGATLFQPTVATNDYTVFHQCIDAVRAYRSQGGKGCIGLHIEGPWINPVKRGAHIESFIHSPSRNQVEELLSYGEGVITMITLAPEVCDPAVVQLIQSHGIVVSAGHSNASYEEATLAFNNGIHAATHLYNAMSPLQHRAPGLVGAILDHDKVKSSVVPDGYHVDFAAIRIAKKIMGSRLFAITDAVTTTNEGPYQHQLEGDRYTADGILSGSALTMIHCVQNLVEKAGIEPEEALRMASLYPAQVMGLDHRFGRIEKGYDAHLLCLNEMLQVTAVID